LLFRFLRWAYQANVIKTFDIVSKMMVFRITGIEILAVSYKEQESKPQTVRLVRQGEADAVNCDLVPKFRRRTRRFHQS